MRRVVEAGARVCAGDERQGHVAAQRPRVLVAAINGCLGRQGVVRGDVVSHVDGETWNGTAGELAARLEGRDAGEVLTLACNADTAVAEALRRRAVVVARTREARMLSRRSVLRPTLASRAYTV